MIKLYPLLLLGCIAGDPPTGEADSELSQFHGRFGSPSIVVDGDHLHAYFPIQKDNGQRVNVAHARSDDGGVTWLDVGDALPRLSKDADPTGAVWAPGAAQIDNNEWMLYYTAVRKGTTQHMCIFRAHAGSPHGPFVDDFDGPLACPDSSLWIIDPYPVQDAQGDWHLLARVDHPDGLNTISLRPLGPHGHQFTNGSDWTVLTHINKGGWEEPVMENAAIVRLDDNGDKRWYVFYSGGSYKNNSYGIGYADCGASINGACDKKTVDAPWLGTDRAAGIFGPGTPTFFKDAQGRTIMAANVWKFSGGENNPKNHGQIMAMFEVHINANHKPVAKLLRFVE